MLEIDDETDEDLLSALCSKEPPPGVVMVASDTVPGLSAGTPRPKECVIVCSRSTLRPQSRNTALAALFQRLFTRLCFRFRAAVPVALCGVRSRINLVDHPQGGQVVELMVGGRDGARGLARMRLRPPLSHSLPAALAR